MAEYAGRYGDDEIVDRYGNPFPPGTEISVYERGTTTLVDLYSDRDRTPADNPTEVKANGNVGFYAEPAYLDLVVGTARVTVKVDTDPDEPVLTPPIEVLPDAATLTPNVANAGGKANEISQNFTLANPTGDPYLFQRYTLRLKTSSIRTITYGSQYRAMGSALPSATVAGKYLYIEVIWNGDDEKWDAIMIRQEA